MARTMSREREAALMRSTRSTVAGVDGCRGGWVAVIAQAGAPVRARVYKCFEDLVKDLHGARVIAVDIPIGLPDCGPRNCDLEARQRLGPRRSSVFPAPLRPVLGAQTHAEACRIRRSIEGKRMSRQSFGILNKVREVDRVLRKRPNLRRKVVEVHPELSFAMWRGRPMRYPKRTAAGKAERLRLINPTWAEAVIRCAALIERKRCGLDDLLDAFAGLWSARRLALAEAIQLPDKPAADSCQLPMRIVA
jgi:predicted RNase H-like nuclease